MSPRACWGARYTLADLHRQILALDTLTDLRGVPEQQARDVVHAARDLQRQARRALGNNPLANIRSRKLADVRAASWLAIRRARQDGQAKVVISTDQLVTLLEASHHG